MVQAGGRGQRRLRKTTLGVACTDGDDAGSASSFRASRCQIFQEDVTRFSFSRYFPLFHPFLCLTRHIVSSFLMPSAGDVVAISGGPNYVRTCRESGFKLQTLGTLLPRCLPTLPTVLQPRKLPLKKPKEKLLSRPVTVSFLTISSPENNH